MRITDGPPGQILVTDSQQGMIFALDERNLEILWTYEVPSAPMGIAYRSNFVFVGNSTTQNVEVYRLQGSSGGSGKTLEFQYNLGFTPAGQPGSIRIPSDIALDQDLGLVFVMDSGERKVKVFDFKGNPIRTFPSPSDPPLLSPVAIAVDEVNKEIVVSDYGDPNGWSTPAAPARIQVYSYSGTLLKQIDGGPAPPVDPAALFSRPQGLAVDGRGHIFMAESVLGQVYVFDRNTGALVKKLGDFGDGPGQLQLPLDLFLDPKSQDLYVTNNMLKRIEVFRNAGALP